MNNKSLLALTISSALCFNTAFANESEQVKETALSNAELKEIILEQKKAIEAIEKRLNETDEMISATADQIESTTNNDSIFSNTTIGGYGELHYNNYDNEDAEIDFHRFVLFFGHEFTDSIRFFSEFELEHSLAGDDKPGEVELEQAYVEKETD